MVFQNIELNERNQDDLKNTDSVPPFGNSFDVIVVRNAFVRKVYSIILAELAMIVTIMLVINLPNIREVILADFDKWRIIAFVLMGVYFVSSIGLVCCGVERKYPWNLVLLTACMACIGTAIGIISVAYKQESLIMAGGLTMAVVIAITLFAFTTKLDFTGCGVYLMVLMVVVSLVGIACIFVGIFADRKTYHIMQMVYAGNVLINVYWSGLGAAVISFSLVYDTQLILIGKHKNSYSPEDYVLAAYSILTDIIQLFLFILQLLKTSNDD